MERHREALVVAGLYILVSLVLTYPLITKLTTHVAGRNIDDGNFVWNLWWIKHAIVDLHSSPFFTDYIFYPLGVSLVSYTLTLANGLIALPLLAVFSPITVNNLLFFFSLTLAGCGAYWLVKDLLTHQFVAEASSVASDEARRRIQTIRFASFVGGVIFAFPASRFMYASYGQANLTSVEWIPFFALFFIRTLRAAFEAPYGRKDPGPLSLVRPSAYKNAFLAAVSFVLATYTEMTFAVFLIVFALIAVLFKAPFRCFGPLLKGLPPLLVAGALSAAGLGPLLWLVWNEARGDGRLSTGWGYADAFSADLLGFFLPTQFHPLFGSAAAKLTAGFTDPNIVFLGWVTLSLGIVGAVRFWKLLRLWAVAGLAFLVLCLGPLLHVGGVGEFDFDGLRANLPLPFLLLHYIPLVQANRTPNRFVVMAMLCLGVLAAFGLYWLLSRLALRAAGRRPPRAALAVVGPLLLTAVLFEHLSIPLPLNEMRVPDVYRLIGRDRGDFTILQLPLGWRNSYGVLGYERTIVQSYQAVHGKRMLGGNTSRNPDFKFGYFSRLPVIGTIIAMEQEGKLDVTPSPADVAIAQRLAALYDIRYLVVHRQYVDPRVEHYAAQVFGLEKWTEDRDVAAYRVPRSREPDRLLVDLGTPESWMNRGEGWADDERVAGDVTANWVVKPSARLFFPAYGGRDLTACLRILPFLYPGMPDQELSVEVNGQLLAGLTLAAEWREYAVQIPAAAQREGLNEMVLHFKHLASPSAVLPGDYRIGATGVTSPVGIAVRSAGLNAGNVGQIEVAGREVSRGRRGYNVVVVDPASGRVERSETFDTFANEAEATRLQSFVDALPVGRIVVGAVKDEGSRALTGGAVAALHSLGLSSDLRGKNRWSQAFICVKGAAAGQALEALGEGTVSLSIGPNPDRRGLAAALDFVEFEAQ